MSGCCHQTPVFSGVSADYKRRLWAVIAINAAMFVIEIATGSMAQSQALKADALDFLADALTYGMSLAVIGAPLWLRSGAAMIKAISLIGMGLWVFTNTVWRFFTITDPQPEIMGAVGLLALAANLASVWLLVRYKDGDANVKSVWLCSRNDAIGNVAVMAAAGAVGLTGSHWPDLVVAIGMATLFLGSARQIMTQAIAETQHSGDHTH